MDGGMEGAFVLLYVYFCVSIGITLLTPSLLFMHGMQEWWGLSLVLGLDTFGFSRYGMLML